MKKLALLFFLCLSCKAQLTNTLLSSNATYVLILSLQGSSPTNAWLGPTNTLDLFARDQYYLTYTPMQISGVFDKSVAIANSVILTITNAASTNVTLYVPTLTTGDGARSYVVTNASIGVLSIKWNPVFNTTNAVYRGFR